MEIAQVEEVLKENIGEPEIHFFINYMASLIKEEPPSNEVDLFKLIGDFLTDGMIYSKQEAQEICKKLNKIFSE